MIEQLGHRFINYGYDPFGPRTADESDASPDHDVSPLRPLRALEGKPRFSVGCSIGLRTGVTSVTAADEAQVQRRERPY